MSWSVLAEGLLFPEGLAWSASDATMIVSSVAGGTIHRLSLDGAITQIADTGGCANGCALGDDGSVIVTQNGNTGAWVQQRLSARFPGRYPVTEERTPGVQRVLADGTVTELAVGGFLAPNDVTVGDDGSIYLTDPGLPNHDATHDPSQRVGRVIAIDADGARRVLADGLVYPNGILTEPGGSVVITERQGVLRIGPDASQHWIVEDVGGRVDGIAKDAVGRFWVAGQAGIQVVDADGELGTFHALPGANTTNCCFGGPDLSWLFVTDASSGSVLVHRDLGVRGAPVALWPAGIADAGGWP